MDFELNRISGRAKGAWLGALVAILGLAGLPGAAGATESPFPNLTITSSIANRYSYSVGSGPTISVDPAANNVSLRASANEGGFKSEVGLDLTSQLDGDNFSFLHDGYCVGTCKVSIYTTLNFSLANTGDDAVAVRWDSLITPGHLAQLGSNGSALFHFIVVDGNDVSASSTVYQESRGETFGWYDQIDQTGAQFAGFQRDVYSEGVGHLNARSYADWSATSLNLDLTSIPGHSTTSLSYISWVEMSYTDSCTDLSACGGVQVAFGDPRNDGGVRSITGVPPFSPLLGLDSGSPLQPYIGRQFGASTTPSAFVEQGSPLPPAPPLLPPVTYGAPFVSQVVPEPASWAMMLFGFGLAGSALRRRARDGASRALAGA